MFTLAEHKGISITESNYRKLSRDIGFLSFFLTATDPPKSLTHTL